MEGVDDLSSTYKTQQKLYHVNVCITRLKQIIIHFFLAVVSGIVMILSGQARLPSQVVIYVEIMSNAITKSTCRTQVTEQQRTRNTHAASKHIRTYLFG